MHIAAGVVLGLWGAVASAATVQAGGPAVPDRVPAPFVQPDGVRVPTWSAPLTSGPDEVLVAAAEALLDDAPADEPLSLQDTLPRQSFGDAPLPVSPAATARPAPLLPDSGVWTPPLLLLTAGAGLVVAAVLRAR